MNLANSVSKIYKTSFYLFFGTAGKSIRPIPDFLNLFFRFKMCNSNPNFTNVLCHIYSECIFPRLLLKKHVKYLVIRYVYVNHEKRILKDEWKCEYEQYPRICIYAYIYTDSFVLFIGNCVLALQSSDCIVLNISVEFFKKNLHENV